MLLPVATRVPRGWRSIEVVVPFCPASVLAALPVAPSNSCSCWFSLALTMVFPSGVMATVGTLAPCRTSCFRGTGGQASVRTTPSLPASATSLPSGLTATALIGVVWITPRDSLLVYSHPRRDPSTAAASTVRAAGMKATPLIGDTWPGRSWMEDFFTREKTRTILAESPETAT